MGKIIQMGKNHRDHKKKLNLNRQYNYYVHDTETCKKCHTGRSFVLRDCGSLFYCAAAFLMLMINFLLYSLWSTGFASTTVTLMRDSSYGDKTEMITNPELMPIQMHFYRLSREHVSSA